MKGMAAAKSVWGLGERCCRYDFHRRLKLFNALVRSVLEYRVEIWGWVERGQLEKIQLDYVRWILRLDFCTPRYIMQKELDLEKMKGRWGIRAWKYEEKVRNRNEEKLTWQCWREKLQGIIKGSGGKERIRFLNNLGLSEECIECWKMQERDNKEIEEEIQRKGRDIEKQEIGTKVEGAKYNC